MGTIIVMNKYDVADILRDFIDQWEEKTDVYTIKDGVYSVSLKIRVQSSTKEVHASNIEIQRLIGGIQ